MLNKIILFSALLFTSIGNTLPAADMISIDATQISAKEIFVTSGDAKLFCRVAGKGQPLIVIHGGPGLTQDYLLPQMYELAKHNLVVFYDQRGCGKSTGEINTATITIKSSLDDIEAIRKTLNFEKISLLGHSWGGFVAMQYAIARPEHVDKLIISNTFPSTSKDWALCGEEYMKRLSPYEEKIKKITNSQEYLEGNSHVMEKFYRLIFRQYIYNPEKTKLLNLRMTPTTLLNGAKVYGCFRENVMDQSFDLSCNLNKLKMNTIVVAGEADLILPITSQHIHENIPASRYILMKNCGHFPYVEDPATYFKCISEFLNPNEN